MFLEEVMLEIEVCKSLWEMSAKMIISCTLHEKALCVILATRFTFIVEKKLKKHVPPATLHVLSRNHI